MVGIALFIVVVVANVAGAGMIVPQVVRLRRTGNVQGISPAWVGVGVALNAWWFLYAVGSGVVAIAPVAAGGVALYVVIAVQLGASMRRAVAAGALIASLGPALGLVAGGWAAVGVVLGLAYAVQFSPALAGALRSVSVEGVAAWTWVLALIEAVAWLVYGSVIGDAALVLGGAGGTVMASALLVVIHGDRRPAVTGATA